MELVLDQPVMVLNRHWAALRVATAADALSMMVRGVAEAIDAEGDYACHDFESWAELSEHRERFEPEKFVFVQAVKQKILIPTVVRLLKYDKLKRRRIRFNRRNVYARDQNTCQYCGRTLPTSRLNLDHVLPRSQGGKSRWDNIVCSCIQCNSRKNDRTPEQAGMKLIRPPQPLKVAVKVPRERMKTWSQFVDEAYWSVELQE